MEEMINNAQQTAPKQEGSSEWEALLHELGLTAESWAQTFGKALEDWTGWVVLPTDGDLRQKLDLLVESGAVKNRVEALKILVESGVVQKAKLFEKIEATRAQIEELKKGLRGMAGSGPAVS